MTLSAGRAIPIVLLLVASAVVVQAGEPSLTIVLRYDDWCPAAAAGPAKRSVDLTVLRLAEKHQVPLSIALIPAPRRFEGRAADWVDLIASDEMIAPLILAARGPVDVALHGLHHAPHGGARTEFANRPEADQLRAIRTAVAAMTKAGFPPPRVFVPPYNSYDEATCRALTTAGLTVLSADETGPLCPPGTVGLLPHSTSLGGLLAHGSHLPVLAERTDDSSATVVVLMHSYDFAEAPSERWPVYATLDTFDTLLGELKADRRIRFASLADVAREQTGELGPDRVQASRTFARYGRLLHGLGFVPYRFIPDYRMHAVYWSLPIYRRLNARAARLVAAAYGCLFAAAFAAGMFVAFITRRAPRLCWGAEAILAAGAAFWSLHRPVAPWECLAVLVGGLVLARLTRLLARRRRGSNSDMPEADATA